jgi:hypothetical protein
VIGGYDCLLKQIKTAPIFHFPHASQEEFIGHKYFSAEKSRDPVSRRRAPAFDSRHL